MTRRVTRRVTRRLRHRVRRTPARSLACGAVACAALLASTLQAQERVVGSHSIGLGASFENISFSGAGVLQQGFTTAGGARINAVQQLTFPVSVATPLAGSWRLDVTTLYASGTVRYTDERSIARESSLSGVSDVRVRATGRLLRDGIVLTLGANLPTGRTSLDVTEFATLRVLSAPALALGTTGVGAGPSGTLGVVFARPVGAWTLATGASYEHRGVYQPVAAIAAGAPSADFLPGGVVRASVAGDRTAGAHRVSIAFALDLFAADRLRTQESTTATDIASVRLGPVMSADAQVQLAMRGLRDLLLYSSVRHRAPFSRDGVRVDSSSGSYVESGARAARALGPRVDALLSFDARWHTGLGIDQGLPTHGVTAAGATLGLQLRRALLTVQPWVRAQLGTLRPTGASSAAGAHGFGGASAGLVVVSRF